MNFWCKLSLGLFLPGHLFAFWVDDGALSREKQVVNVTVESTTARVEIIEEIKNVSTISKRLTYLYPLGDSVQLSNFFVNSLGHPVHYLRGKEKDLYLIDQVINYENVNFFRLHQSLLPKLVVSDEIFIPAGKSVKIKLVYETPLDFIHDFYFSELFLSDGNETKDLQIFLSINHRDKVKHFFTIADFKGKEVRNSEQLSWAYWGKNVVMESPFVFYFSEILSPKMYYQDRHGQYVLQFENLAENLVKPSRLRVFVDDSGSMYGLPWEKLGNIFRELLESDLFVDTTFKVSFLNQAENEVFPDFMVNDFDFQKKVLTYFDSQSPMGKLNFTRFFNELSSSEFMYERVLLIGDFSDLSTEQSTILFDEFVKLPSNPVLFVVDFSAEKSDLLKRMAHFSGGSYLSVFNSTFEFLKEADFFTQLGFLGSYVSAPEDGFFPRKIQVNEPHQELIFIKQIPRDEDLVYAPSERFIARMWAGFRVSDVLRSALVVPSQEVLDDNLIGVASIVRNMGISGRLFDEFSSPHFFRDILELTDKSVIFDNVYDLERLSAFKNPSAAKFQGDRPFYWNDKGQFWQQNNFEVGFNQNPAGNILVEPFSGTYKNLFLAFPDFFAEIFVMGPQVKACSAFRCLQTQYRVGDIIERSDLVFWDDLDDHWSYDYLFRLYKHLNNKNGELSLGQRVFSGDDFPRKIDPEKLLTRADFVHLLIPDNGFTDDTTHQSDFTDILDPILGMKVDWLVNKGVIKGFNALEFKPNEKLTRAQVVKILLSYEGWMSEGQSKSYEYPEILPFLDIEGWEKPWVTEAFIQGKVRGYGDGVFKPKQGVTLGEAAKLILEMKR